ncbi:hypothetical protein DRN73_09485 [Candidatus Pacearchaeota archaeon]|nr:MAG: hypothetical protein DRN73_09485 [Candidatus Pacearchaeota archaeon]
MYFLETKISTQEGEIKFTEMHPYVLYDTVKIGIETTKINIIFYDYENIKNLYESNLREYLHLLKENWGFLVKAVKLTFLGDIDDILTIFETKGIYSLFVNEIKVFSFRPTPSFCHQGRLVAGLVSSFNLPVELFFKASDKLKATFITDFLGRATINLLEITSMLIGTIGKIEKS